MKLPYLYLIPLLFLPFTAPSQVLHHYVKNEKPEYCSDDSLYSKSIIGRKVRIFHDGGIYSTINTTNYLKWPSKELKAKSGINGWGSFVPKTGDTGTVVHIFYDKQTRKDNIYLINIGDHYVPIGCNSITDSFSSNFIAWLIVSLSKSCAFASRRTSPRTRFCG